MMVQLVGDCSNGAFSLVVLDGSTSVLDEPLVLLFTCVALVIFLSLRLIGRMLF